MGLEQEIKIPVASLAGVRDALERLGAHLETERSFEENLVLDDGQRTLAGRGCLLRLRSFAGEALLTFKGPASFEDNVKSRLELETAVGDLATMEALLASLGFEPARRYQKWREVWTSEGVTVVLDETPMGSFVELEGEASALGGLARALALDPTNAVPASYVELWMAYRDSHPEAPVDMVFQ